MLTVLSVLVTLIIEFVICLLEITSLTSLMNFLDTNIARQWKILSNKTTWLYYNKYQSLQHTRLSGNPE